MRIAAGLITREHGDLQLKKHLTKAELKKTVTNDGGDVSKTVENALLLLDSVRRLGPVTIGDLAQDLSLNRTVVYRLATTLQRRCFIIKFGNSYILGPALLKLADGVLPELRSIINPTLQRLGMLTQETVSCAVRDGNNWIIVDQVLDSTHGVHVREEVGKHFPLHLGAHGHALVATMSAEALKAYYSKVSVPPAIRKDIALAKSRGYACSRGELRRGVIGIAATGSFKSMPFSLAVIMPTLRESELRSHLSPLREAIQSISNKIE